MTKLRVATWNINSVRLRADLVAHFLKEHQPDVLCLQEIKCHDSQFPASVFNAAGYPHIALNGQKGWHGVAIVSRLPIVRMEKLAHGGNDEARHVAVEIEHGGRNIRIDGLYVPAGGDIADIEQNPKFAHKLRFLADMKAWVGTDTVEGNRIMVGDFNVAPLESDVWSHKQLLDVVSHTPVETELLESIRTGGAWIDVMRHVVPPPTKLYSWWSYRAADWTKADRGRRLDHIWCSPALAPAITTMTALREARGWEKPSDHVPVIADFEW